MSWRQFKKAAIKYKLSDTFKLTHCYHCHPAKGYKK